MGPVAPWGAVMGKKVHKDVEFEVSEGGRNRLNLGSFEDAVVHALDASLSTGRAVNLDVLCLTKAGFRAAVKAGIIMRDEDDYDPDASVSQRFEIKAKDWGKIP